MKSPSLRTSSAYTDVSAPTIGHVWITLIEALLRRGQITKDEGRVRRSINHVHLHIDRQRWPDSILQQFSPTKNMELMVDFTFRRRQLYDIDVVKSFTNHAKSYHQRIVEGKMLEFVVSRLARIPESKKAVMVFPTYADYRAVLKHPRNDYLPCIVAIQFRLHGRGRTKTLDTIFFSRSMDVFQKGHGNLASMVLLSQLLAQTMRRRKGWQIQLGRLEGLITDAHIYRESWAEARKTIRLYRKARI